MGAASEICSGGDDTSVASFIVDLMVVNCLLVVVLGGRVCDENA